MKKLFLICALALPSTNFRSARQFVKEYNALKAWVEHCYPGQEYMIIPEMLHEIAPKGWEYIPIHWRGQIVYRRSA